MLSRTALICKHYAQVAQKPGQKFCAQKTAEKNKTHPKSSKKGETGCVSGAGGGSSGWRRMRADGKGRSEQGRGGRLLLSLAKMEGRTCLACWLGQLAAERHWRSLAPRHAVLEWMWESAAGSGEGLGVTRFPPQVPERAVLVWCCELFLEKDCVSTTTSSFERKAPPPEGWPS